MAKTKEKISEYNKKYNLKNRDRLRKHKREYMRKNKERFSEKKHIYNMSLDGKFKSYKASAKTRNLEFTLTKEDFKKFWDKPCYYCGLDIFGIGLDRINNSVGYNLTNIVSCCRYCNIAKNNMKKEDYIELCNLVAINHPINLENNY